LKLRIPISKLLITNINLILEWSYIISNPLLSPFSNSFPISNNLPFSFLDYSLNLLLGPQLQQLKIMIPLLNGSPSFLLLNEKGASGLLSKCRGSLSKVSLLLNGTRMDGCGNPLGMLEFQLR